jgi:hypothetical protein
MTGFGTAFTHSNDVYGRKADSWIGAFDHAVCDCAARRGQEIAVSSLVLILASRGSWYRLIRCFEAQCNAITRMDWTAPQSRALLSRRAQALKRRTPKTPQAPCHCGVVLVTADAVHSTRSKLWLNLPTQLIVLSSAAKHDDGLATRPSNLNAAAATKVASSLIIKASRVRSGRRSTRRSGTRMTTAASHSRSLGLAAKQLASKMRRRRTPRRYQRLRRGCRKRTAGTMIAIVRKNKN